MPVDSKINKFRKRAKISRTGHEGRAHPHDLHASMRESVDLTPLPGPRGSAEASDEIDRNFGDAMNFPASTQDSTALEPLQGEMIDSFDAVAKSPEDLTVREMRRAGLTSEMIWETVAARHKKAKSSRPASLQMPPYYHIGGERAEPPRGRKRTFEAGNESSLRSSPSSVSSRSSSSRPSQPYRPSLIGPGDGGESVRRTAGGGLAVPTTVGERGGGSAPAQRRNLSPAHGDKHATYRSVVMGRGGAASGKPAAGGGSMVPATVGERGGGAALAQRHNLSPAHGNSANTYQGIEGVQSEAASGEHAAAGGPAEPASLESDQARYLFKHNPQLWLIQSLLKQLAPEEMWAQLTETLYSPTSGEGSVDGARGEPAARGGPTGPATVGERGSGAAPAQRRNLSPTRGPDPTTHRSEVAAQSGASSGELAASGEPAISKYHSLPAHVTEPYQHTPVNYEPFTPTSCEVNEDAGAKDGNIPTAESFAPPSRSAGKRQGRAASPPQSVQSAAGRVTGPSGFVPLAGGHGPCWFSRLYPGKCGPLWQWTTASPIPSETAHR